MAFELRKEREFELGLTYVGPTAVLEFEFSFFFPNGADDLAFLLNAALFSIDVLPIVQTSYLRYTIESDKEPFPDRYRVKITLAGDVDAPAEGILGPFPLFSQVQAPQAVFAIPALAAIIVALGIVLVLAVFAWKIYNGGLWGAIFGGGGGGGGGGLPAPWAAAVALGATALGLYFIFGRGRARNA